MSEVEISPIPAPDWEQQGPIGGAFDGQSPAVALNVNVVGNPTMREMPALMGSSGSLAPGAIGAYPLLSADPHRRAVTIGGISGTPRISTHRATAEAGGGCPVPAGANAIRIQYAGELFVYFPTVTDSVGFLCEIDPD